MVTAASTVRAAESEQAVYHTASGAPINTTPCAASICECFLGAAPAAAFPRNEQLQLPSGAPGRIRRLRRHPAEPQEEIKQVDIYRECCSLCWPRRPQLFANVQLCDATVAQTLIDTGATFSMIPARTIALLRIAPSVENFSSAPPRVVGVGGASATVRGYIDAPLVIAGTRVRHPLIVVEELAYPLLIGMDILGLHDAQLGVGASSSICLAVERCTVCDEMRAGPPRLTCPNEAAYVSKEVTLALCAASRVAVRLPSSILFLPRRAVPVVVHWLLLHRALLCQHDRRCHPHDFNRQPLRQTRHAPPEHGYCRRVPHPALVSCAAFTPNRRSPAPPMYTEAPKSAHLA